MDFNLSRALGRWEAEAPKTSLERCSLCAEHADEAALRALEPVWRELFGACSYPTPFASWEWASAWWENFRSLSVFRPQSPRLLIITVRNAAGCVIGLAPFYFLDAPRDYLALRSLRLFGAVDGAESATEEPIILLRAGHEEEALAAILRYVKRPGASQVWDYLTMRWPVSASPLSNRAALRPRFIETRLSERNEMVSLPDSWIAFRLGLSKSMRDNLAYYPRLLTRGGHDWMIRVVEEPGGMAEAAETLVALHHRRANSAQGVKHSNHLPEETHRCMLTSVLPRLAERNMASIFLLEVDGAAIAALCALENAGVMTIYYTGFNTAWHRCSPITLLTAEAIRCAIAKGCSAVNFLPTPMTWKTRWGASSQQQIQELRLLRVRPVSLLRGCAARRANGR